MFSTNGIIFSLFLLNHLNNLVICADKGPIGADHPFYKWYNESLADCRRSLMSLIGVDELRLMLNDVYYIDAPDGIRLKGDITFESLSITGTLKAPDVKSYNFSHTEIISDKFQTIDHSLRTIENEVFKLNNKLEAALRTTGNQEVSGNITFANAYFNCGNGGCNVKSIETSTFNGRQVDQLSSNVYRLNRDEEFSDSIEFADLVVNDIDVDFINTIASSDIVTRNGNHTIEGPVIFENPVSVNQLHSKTVNGHVINRQTVLTTTDNQIINSPVSFTHDISVKDLDVAALPQLGEDFNAFLSNVVQIDRNHTITGKKTFNGLIVDNLAVDGGKINGFDLAALSRHLLTQDAPQTIDAHVAVGELIINGNINIDQINGNKIEELLVRRKVPTVIKGDKIFTGPVHARSISINGTLNRRSVINGSLGLMLKRGSQVITGKKTFNDIEVKNVSVFHGNVGPLSVESLTSNLERMILGGERRVLSGPIHLENINVTGKVNGIELSSLMTDYLKVNQTTIPNINLNISRAYFDKPLRCDRINGLKFPDDFITIKTDQIITGNTHISNNLLVTSSLNLTKVNGYNLNDTLWDSLTSTKDQTITATKTIKGNLFIKNLQVTSLNNMKMNDLVLLNGKGIILGKKTFSSINITGLTSVASINGVRTINRIAINELFSNSITKRNSQSISPVIHVKKLVIPLDTNVNVSELAGMKLNDILSSVVYLRSNETQIIRGKKRFASQATFGNLVFTSTFAGYSKDDFQRRYLSQSPTEINANISINSDLFIDKELIVTGRVNELHTPSLSRHLPVTGKPIIINRPMNLRYVRIIGGNVQAPTINGIKFAQEMITRKSPINFSGNAHFLHGVMVNNLTVGSINNVTIGGSVCNPIQNVFDRPYSLTITGNVVAAAPIRTNRINNQTFDQTTSLIRGVKKFKRLNINGPIHLSGRLNNFDVQYLKRTYLSRTKNQTFDSEVILRNATFSGPVFIGGHLSGRDIFTNGFDIAKMASTSLRNTGNQNIEGTFFFPGRVIFKKGLFNSPLITLNETTINVQKNAFRKSQPNEINSKIIFNSVSADELQTPNSRSNLHRDLNNLNSITQFYGWKNFTYLDIDDLVVDYINGIPTASLLRSDADANITGTLSLDSSLAIKPNLTVFGTVNGIKLQLLGSKLVLAGENNSIEAPITLKFKSTARSLLVPGPWKRNAAESLNDLSIPKKLRSLKHKIALHSSTLRTIDNYLKKRNGRTNGNEGY